MAALALAVYAAVNSSYNAHRPDFYYLADAFLHGRTWLDQAFGAWDVIRIDGRIYVPFAPFPALLYLPLVALLGPASAAGLGQSVVAALAAAAMGLAWALVGRLGVLRPADRLGLVLFLGFGTPVLWIATRGGVWHEGQLAALVLTLAALVETFGRRRAPVVGVLLGAAFLSRATLAFALPFFAYELARSAVPARSRIRAVVTMAVAAAPFFVFALWYNAARFGSPLESGYGLASLPPFLEQQREQGLFALVHLPMNLDYLLWHLPALQTAPPFIRPDGLGMSILLTSPAVLLAGQADWRSGRVRALALTTVLVLLPSLLYYGGGWLQYGYRYALDAMPFWLAIMAMAVARKNALRGWGRGLIWFGVLVNLVGVYWAHVL